MADARDIPEHKRVIQEQFTTTTESYAASAVLADQEARRAFARFVGAAPGDRVLDFATGTGFTGLAFAEDAGMVVGLDITASMLRRALQERDQRDIRNFSVLLGDIERAPVTRDAFDVVTCTSSFHHFPDLEVVVREMARVCRPGGRIAIRDITTSEDPAQAEAHQRMERLRDPSHTWCLTPSRMEALLDGCGLRVARLELHDTSRELEEWLAIARPSAEVAQQVRALMAAAIEDNRAGLQVRRDGDTLWFVHTYVWVVAIKP